MAALADVGIDFMQDFLSGRSKTVKDLSSLFKEWYPNTRGVENGIRRKGYVLDEILDELV